jgi:DNA-directed RNA polymerase I, II, and III subunit RPABC2
MAEKTVFEIEGDDSDSGSDDDSDSGSESGSVVVKLTGGNGSDDEDYDEDEEEEEEEEEDFDQDEKYENQNIEFSNDDEDEDDDEDDDENNDDNYLQKFNESLKTNVIAEHHPELIIQNFHEVDALCTIVRNADGIIIDPLHKTLPFITKYEKAKVLGERAKQLNSGAEAFVEMGDEIIDGYLIAMAEFEQKKIPMIVRRPLPNGGSEFWRLADLEVL